MNGRNGKCRGGCCRTPFDVCGKQNNCACHWRETNKDRLQAAIEEQNAQQRKIAYQDALKGATAGEKHGLYARQMKGGI